MARARFSAVLAAVVVLTTVGCGFFGSGSAVTPLAKTDMLASSPEPWPNDAVLLVVFDRPAAQQAWEDLIPDNVDRERGTPRVPGLYGGVDDVDFDTQVMALWAGSESGCRSWLEDLDRTDDGSIEAVVASEEDDCLDYDAPYYMMVAIDRELLPARAELPVPIVVREPGWEPAATIDVYPS